MDDLHKSPESIQEILSERARLEKLLKEKFSRPVAIMLTDISGSTRFFETYGDVAGREMVAKHHNILFPIIEKQGKIVDAVGDAMMLYFDDPKKAVKTAIKMQRALQEHNRHAIDLTDEIRIRIGINYGVGIVEEKENGAIDIYGDVVNTAARVETGGDKKPDQILISRSVYEAIQGSEEIICKYYGLVEAKGKAEPLEIYQVIWDPTRETDQELAPLLLPSCPYPGMVPFRTEDARFFYGRDTEIKQMIWHLRQQNFLIIIGPSGSGKSSLVFAGLLPQLRASSYFSKDFWLIRQMRPGSKPNQLLNQLLREPARMVPPTESSQEKASVSNVSLPENSQEQSRREFGWKPDFSTIQALLTNHPPSQRFLLVIDQLEELFTQANPIEQSQFITTLQTLRKLENCAILITLRADFYPELMNSDLWPIDGSQRLEVVPLKGESLRRAIQQPALDVGVKLEAGLVERLIADAAEEPGVLPLLQETMILLWGEMQNRVLLLSTYEKLSSAAHNGLAVVLTIKADAALAELVPSQQAIARRIFLRLIQFGEGRADTRRQQSISSLRSADDDPAEFDRTLEHLTSNRLVTRSSKEWPATQALSETDIQTVTHSHSAEKNEDEGQLVDIAHEALITGWQRLKTWIEERREAEQTRRQLEAKAVEWIRLGSGNGGLLDKAELPEAERWLASSDAIDLGYDATLPKLVEASRAAIKREEQEKEAIRERELAQARALAEEQQRIAELESQKAEEQARTTTRLRRLAVALGMVFLLAVGAALLAWMQQQKAQINAVKADKARIEAEQLAKAEADARTEAEARRSDAEKAQKEAERLRLVSVAPALVAQALRQQELKQEDLSALLARQAYLFNQRSQGQVLDLVDDVLRTVLDTFHFSRVLRGHESTVFSVAFSPDGQSLASGSGDILEGKDNVVRVWDLRQPDPNSILLRGYEDQVRSVAFSPDSQMLASGSRDGIVRIWNLQHPDAAPILLRGHEWSVMSVMFSPDRKILASGGDDGTVRLWNLQQSNAAPVPLRSREGETWSVAFSPDGSFLASGGDKLQLWDLRQPGAAPIFLRGHEDWISSVAFSPDGKMLASGSRDDTIRIWRLDQPDIPSVPLRGHEGDVWSVAFSPDGNRLASAGADRTVRLWNLPQPTTAPVILRGHKDEVWSVAFSPDGKTLASGSADRTILIWIAQTQILADKVCEKVKRNITWDEWQRFVGADLPYERTCPKIPVHPSFIEQGENLAKTGDREGAIAIFQRARELDSDLELEPESKVKELLATTLVMKGEMLAKIGDVDRAVDFFQKAIELNPGLGLEPKAKARELYATDLIVRGENLARSGDMNGAVALFYKALELNPDLALNPEVKAKKLAAPGLIEEGERLVKQGQVKESLSAFAQAQALDPTLKISAKSWNTLCWFGSTWGHAMEVMNACEQAIVLEPGNSDFRDSRGLARAQTGNVEGAIEDFEAFVGWTKVKEDRIQRQRWTEALRAGENPFTSEVLEKLRYP